MSGAWTVAKIIEYVLTIVNAVVRRMDEADRESIGRHLQTLDALSKAQETAREADAIRERVRRGELDDPFLRP